MQIRKKIALAAGVILGLSATSTLSAPRIGQSAIQTLAFPWGARSLGMAETFTGIADNAEAIFYNPAGLGQAPLSKTWIHSFNQGENYRFIQISAKPNRGLADKEFIWALRDNGKIYKFNGVTWIDHSLHILEEGQTLREVAEEYIDAKEYSYVDSAITQLKLANSIGAEAQKEILGVLNSNITVETNIDSLATLLTYLPLSSQNETDVLQHVFEFVSDEESESVVSQILEILNKPSEFSSMLEVKVPFNLGRNAKINDISVDYSGRLWVAAEDGAWRFDGTWKQYTTRDGLQSDTILTVSQVGETETIIGTQKGIASFQDGVFTKIAPKKITLPSRSIVRSNEETLLIATDKGIYKVKDEKEVTKYTIKSGLLSDTISTLMVDSRGRIWAGAHGGLSIFNGKKWKQYKFKGSQINAFAEIKDGLYWIATDKGAVEMKESEGSSPEWKVFHDKNGLPNSEINDLVQFGDDSWLATSGGVSQRRSGEVHVTAFFEQLLPSLKIDDIWHAALAGVVPVGSWGAVGLSTNYLYFGEVPNYNADGSINQNSEGAFEFVGALSYGLPIKPTFSVGLNMKFAYSKLSSDAQTGSFSMDAALLKRDLFIKDLSLGFSMLNMGPAVHYEEENSKDPIPFTMRYGMAYKPLKTPAVELLVAFDLDREIVYTHNGEAYPFYKAIYYDLFNDEYESLKDELSKIILHLGTEFTYAQLISGRVGYMHDKAGERREVTFGLGLSTSVILADFGIIITTGENDIRNQQIRFSLTYVR